MIYSHESIVSLDGIFYYGVPPPELALECPIETVDLNSIPDQIKPELVCALHEYYQKLLEVYDTKVKDIPEEDLETPKRHIFERIRITII